MMKFLNLIFVFISLAGFSQNQKSNFDFWNYGDSLQCNILIEDRKCIIQFYNFDEKNQVQEDIDIDFDFFEPFDDDVYEIKREVKKIDNYLFVTSNNSDTLIIKIISDSLSIIYKSNMQNIFEGLCLYPGTIYEKNYMVFKPKWIDKRRNGIWNFIHLKSMKTLSIKYEKGKVTDTVWVE